MPLELKKIAFIVGEFAVPSPAQQLVDRFLLGYPVDGGFHKPAGCSIVAYLLPGAPDTELRRRAKDFGLIIAGSVQEVVAEADAVVIVWPGTGTVPVEGVLSTALDHAPAGSVCFVNGPLAANLAEAREMRQLAETCQIALASGSPLGVTWRLPQIEWPESTALKEALVVVQGSAPGAEWDGLESLLPLVGRRSGGETGWRRIRHLAGPAVWRAGDDGAWSWELLASALSRSDSPQGDAVADGRTQDLVGLGLVPKLAQAPRAWLIEHRDGLRSAILVLDGVVADYNLAVRAAGGRIYSAQIHRAPPPAQHHFSRLAGALEEFMRRGRPPWPPGHSLLIAGGLAAFADPRAHSGKWVETKELAVG